MAGRAGVALVLAVLLSLLFCLPAHAVQSEKASSSEPSFKAMATPSLSKKALVFQEEGATETVKIKGMSSSYSAEVVGGDHSVADVFCWDDKSVEVESVGEGVSTYTIRVTNAKDDVVADLKLKVTVMDLGISYTKQIGSGMTLYKGENAKVKVTGNTANLKVTYTSSDPKVVAVSASGAVKARGFGQASIVVKAGSKFRKVIGVSVGTVKGVKAVRWAISKTPAYWDPAKRMQEGYFNCVSLVGRAYASTGLYIPNKSKLKDYTAADQAEWCVKKGHLVLDNRVDYSVMRPGDVVYLISPSLPASDRYKHINHAALYAGNGKTVEVRFGLRDVLEGQVVMVGRPTQYAKEVTAPTGLKAKKASSTSVKVSWKAQKGVSGYKVYRALDNPKMAGSEDERITYELVTTISNKNKTSYLDKGLKKGTKYRYMVCAYYKKGSDSILSSRTPYKAVKL